MPPPSTAMPHYRLRGVTFLLGAILLLVLAAAGAGHWIYNVADVSDGPMLIAGRRGDIARWPENTLEGVTSAAAQGADAIEFDVRSSADGTFYLMHDADVDRTTDGTGLVASLSDAEIDKLTIDAGMGYSGHAGLRVPRLEHVLAALRDYPGLLLVDVKSPAQDHAALANLLAGHRAWISCGSEEDVRAVGGAMPTYGPAGAGVDHVMKDSPLAFGAFFDRASVSPIYWWWEGSEADVMARAQRWGVHVYITNDLAAAISWAAADGAG